MRHKNICMRQANTNQAHTNMLKGPCFLSKAHSGLLNSASLAEPSRRYGARRESLVMCHPLRVLLPCLHTVARADLCGSNAAMPQDLSDQAAYKRFPLVRRPVQLRHALLVTHGKHPCPVLREGQDVACRADCAPHTAMSAAECTARAQAQHSHSPRLTTASQALPFRLSSSLLSCLHLVSFQGKQEIRRLQLAKRSSPTQHRNLWCWWHLAHASIACWLLRGRRSTAMQPQAARARAPAGQQCPRRPSA